MGEEQVELEAAQSPSGRADTKGGEAEGGGLPSSSGTIVEEGDGKVEGREAIRRRAFLRKLLVHAGEPISCHAIFGQVSNSINKVPSGFYNYPKDCLLNSHAYVVAYFQIYPFYCLTCVFVDT